MKVHLKKLLFIYILLIYLSLAQNIENSLKVVKVSFEQILPNSDINVQTSKLISLEEFIQKVQDDPSSLLDMKDVYVVDWPAKIISNTIPPKIQPKIPIPSSNPPASPKTPIEIPPPKLPSPTSTPVPPVSTPPTQPTPPAQQPKPTPTPTSTSTTTTTKTQLIGNTPAQTTTTTITTTSNQQLLNPSSDLNSVLSKFNIPNNQFDNILDAFKSQNNNIGGSSSGGSTIITNKQTTNNGKTTSTQSTQTTTNQNNPSISPPTNTNPKTTTPPAPPAPPAPPTPLSSSFDSIPTMRQQMRALTNNLRAKYGAGNVVMNSLLTKIAQDHSNDMVTRNFFDHKNPDGQSSSDRADRNGYTGMIGENLVQAQSINQAQIRFENSPLHFKNAINPDWQQIGVGIAIKGSTLFITVLFSPRNIAQTRLSSPQIQNIKNQIAELIKSSSPTIKTLDNELSSNMQEWMDGKRNISLMQHIANKGYRSPMTAATYTVDYSKNFIERVKKNRYFQNGNSIFRKCGVGIKQIGLKLEINVIYM